MVQELEKAEQIILLGLSGLKETLKVEEEVEVKVEKVSAKNFAKYHEGLICIKDMKVRLDAKSYGMRLNSF